MSAAIKAISSRIIEAQHIILEAQGLRSDPREAVRRLAVLMCSIEANHAFHAAGIFAAMHPADTKSVITFAGSAQ